MDHVKHATLKKKTENISWGNVRRGDRSDGKPSGRRPCPTRNLPRWIPRISSPSWGRFAGFRPTTVHSRLGSSTTTRLLLAVTKPSNYKGLRILILYSCHIDSCVSWGHLRQTYCQHSLYLQTLLLVGSHAAPPLFGTVFCHLYALLTASLVLCLSSRLMCS